jgi:molybdate transport system substrate-binding protein
VQISKLIASISSMLFILSACSSPAHTPLPPAAASTTAPAANLTVFAAASLTGAFNEMGALFEKKHPGAKVTFNFAGSQDLRSQLEQGAQAEVFASADTKNMDQLKGENLLRSDPQVFAHNRLVVIVPKSNPAGIKTLQDLSKPGLKIVIADASVPVGNYALQALDKMSADSSFGASFKETVLKSVVSKETNVKAVVSKVSLGEADAGIAYSTDAQAAAEKLTTIEIPDAFNVIATYPIAALKSAGMTSAANEFVEFVLSPDGQAVLAKYGFVAE